MHRFFSEDGASIRGEELKHLRQVLRLAPGDEIEVLWDGRRLLAELTEELRQMGYLKARTARQKQPKVPPSKPMHFIASDGTDIFVGKNNRQNDALTAKAAGEDIWLHTKEIPGSHVILKSPAPSKEALYEACLLAAWYSKARGSENVPVDYTPRKYVKKPGGAKPGMVIYTTNKTAYVTPEEARVLQIQKA